MTIAAHSRSTPPAPTVDSRRWLRQLAIAVSALVTGLYVVLFFVVRNVESGLAPPMDTTYGAYLFLAIAYAVSTAAYAVRPRRAVWVTGALLQVVVLGLFVVFGIGLLGPGVFDYAALVAAIPVGLWAGAVTALQVVLLALLGYLATSTASGRRAA